jgi:hypothetical protein
MHKIFKVSTVIEGVRKARGRVNATFSPTIRVSVGDYHLPYLTLVNIRDGNGESLEQFLCLHEKRSLPTPKLIQGNGEGFLHNKDLSYVQITYEDHNIILDAIIKHEEFQGLHVNSHTFLFTWCLSEGLDLYKKGYLDM